ncbi:hypothetical protein J6590_081051 [Homalodisca vitripennis]|nr:hypothetical protein J6590_081051 [Homalodisca vitripennis]
MRCIYHVTPNTFTIHACQFAISCLNKPSIDRAVRLVTVMACKQRTADQLEQGGRIEGQYDKALVRRMRTGQVYKLLHSRVSQCTCEHGVGAVFLEDTIVVDIVFTVYLLLCSL